MLLLTRRRKTIRETRVLLLLLIRRRKAIDVRILDQEEISSVVQDFDVFDVTRNIPRGMI